MKQTTKNLLALTTIPLFGIVVLVLVYHYLWVSFIPLHSWKFLKWFFYLLYGGGYALIVKSVNSNFGARKLALPLWNWRQLGALFLVTWGGTEATLGFFAAFSSALPEHRIEFCALVVEHMNPREFLMRKEHLLTVVAQQDAGKNEFTFSYLRSNIKIDEVQKGDSVIITGNQSLLGIQVINIRKSESCR